MHRLFTCSATAVAIFVAAPTMAQEVGSYSVKPVTLVVPFPAGGPTDALGRLLAQKLSENVGRQFIIDNRPGAGGNTGSAHVARATPNGYTLVLGTVATHGINPSLYKNMPYDHKKDFAPVSQISIVPNVLVTHPSLPVKSVPQLVAFLKRNPGKVFYASPGHGTSIHLAAELSR